MDVETGADGAEMIDPALTVERLQTHLHTLTRTIGERSVSALWNLRKAAEYIEECYRQIGIPNWREEYQYRNETVANVVAEVGSDRGDLADTKTYLVGAHYDSLTHTVGADDNASGVAVQLEVARALAAYSKKTTLPSRIKFVSFALEEPPAYGTSAMGSKVYARKAKRQGERIDGMICLEMVGYTCHEPRCQRYPLFLKLRNYPEFGDYIGIVGNYRSRKFTRALYNAFQQNEALPVLSLTVPWSGYLLPETRLSDHASFWDRGFKAVMITDTSFFRNPHYHRRTDTMDTLDFDFMAQLVNSLVIYFTGSSH